MYKWPKIHVTLEGNVVLKVTNTTLTFICVFKVSVFYIDTLSYFSR